jgi:hypothetical protein
MSICVINSVFDGFRMGSLVKAGLLTLVPSVSIPLVASIIFQVYCFWSCLGVYKDMVQPSDSPLPRSIGDASRPFLHRDGFVAFGGEGRRLG